MSTNLRIEHKNNSKDGAFVAYYLSDYAGEMDYLWEGTNVIIINHTQVEPIYSGHGIASKLLDKAVEYARKNQLKIVPLCQFVKSKFDKDPVRFQDVEFRIF